MTFTLNEYEIDTAAVRAAHDSHRPNLQRAVLTLDRLKDWTNENSDGWAYWRKPCAASAKLQEIVSNRYFSPRHMLTDADIPEALLKKAYTPIKAFLTRQGVDHSVIFIND